jgi:DNA mismatch repair protein MutS
MTGMGSRLLKTWLLEPPRDRSIAQARLDAIARLRATAPALALRAQLKGAATWSASPPASRCARCARASWWPCRSRCSRPSWPAGQWREGTLAQLADELQAPPECAALLQRAIRPSRPPWCATAA